MNEKVKQPIKSMPDVYRYSIDNLNLILNKAIKYKILTTRKIWRAITVSFVLCPISANAITAGKTNTKEKIEFLTALSDLPAIPVKVICSLRSAKIFIPCCCVAKKDCTINITITLSP